jgi:hypothetical protein
MSVDCNFCLAEINSPQCELLRKLALEEENEQQKPIPMKKRRPKSKTP